MRFDVSDLAPGRMRAVDCGGTKVLLCNVDGEIYAVENECSHASVPLDDGTLEGCELECAFHGALFDVRDGRALALPAKRGIRSFEVVREGDEIEVRV